MQHEIRSASPSVRQDTSPRHTRRVFLARVVGLGATIAALDVLLAACGGGQPAATPAASTAGTAIPTVAGTVGTRSATAAVGATPPAGAGSQIGGAAPTAAVERVTPTGQIIYAARMSELATLHPFAARFTSALAASYHINEGLTKFAPDFGILPGLATKWEISGDGLTFTFALRQGVKWHDGRPLTARDVKFTIDAAGAADSKSPAQPTLKGFLASVETPDDATVAIKLSKPYSPLLAVLAEQLPILPQHLLDGKVYDEGFSAKPIGTGPYKVADRQTATLTLEANPEYWGQLPYTARIIFRDAPEAAAAQAGLLTGELDVIGYTPTTMQGLKAQGYPVFRGPAGSVHGINVDLQNPILQDAKVRRALLLGLDRQRIQAVQYTEGVLANTILSPAYGQYHDETLAPVTQDAKAAAALLDEAGWKIGASGIREKDGQPLKLNYQAWASQDWQNIAAIAQASWKQIGVDVAIQTVELARLTDTMSGKYDLATVGWPLTSDPIVGLNLLLQSTDKTLKDGGTRNVFRYKNAQVDATLAEAFATTDLPRRVALARQIQKQVYDDLPLLPFAHPAYQLICKQGIVLDETGKGGLSSIGTGFFMNRWRAKA
jgi:peptide/nickel transport system substrate-binding protein